MSTQWFSVASAGLRCIYRFIWPIRHCTVRVPSAATDNIILTGAPTVATRSVVGVCVVAVTDELCPRSACVAMVMVYTFIELCIHIIYIYTCYMYEVKPTTALARIHKSCICMHSTPNHSVIDSTLYYVLGYKVVEFWCFSLCKLFKKGARKNKYIGRQ